MGILTAPKSEILETGDLESETRNPEKPNGLTGRIETRTAGFEHNGRVGLGAGQPHLARPVTREPAATMANELFSAPTTDSEAAAAAAYIAKHEFDGFLGKAFEEKPIWAGLYESIQDVFFPPKLPPLQLTSTPIPVPDRMKVKANPWAIGIATGVNLVILALVLYFGARILINKINQPPTQAVNVDVGDYKFQGPKGPQAGGGGGGGDHSLIDPTKGRLPKKAPDPIVQPQVQTVEKPLLAIEPAINVQPEIKIPDNLSLPTLGVTKSANVQLASNGEGGGTGIGTGYGGGIGTGNGNGYGPGTGGNTGGGLYKVGGGISAPVALNNVEAEFSDEARRAKYQGVCIISLIVDANGNPQNPRVIRTLGMGLDEKALEAVRKYKFKPAMKADGTRVPVMINVEVNFRLY